MSFESGSTLRFWLMNNAIVNGDIADHDSRDYDRFLTDGRTMFAQFYGEAPRESAFAGSEGSVLVGHVHLEGIDHYESFLSTLEGKTLRVVTATDSGKVVEGPKELSTPEELGLIALLDASLE